MSQCTHAVDPRPYRITTVGDYHVFRFYQHVEIHNGANEQIASFDPFQNVLDIHHFTAPQAAPHTIVPQHTNSSTDMATATTAAGAMMDECHRMMAALITAGCATSDSPIDFTIHCPATKADESFTVHHLQGGNALCICHESCDHPTSCGALLLRNGLCFEWDFPCCAGSDKPNKRKVAIHQCVASIAAAHRFTFGGEPFSVKRRGSNGPNEQVPIPFKIGHHFEVCDKDLRENLPDESLVVWKGVVNGKRHGNFRLEMVSPCRLSTHDSRSHEITSVSTNINITTSHYLIPLVQCMVDDLSRRVHNLVSGVAKWDSKSNLMKHQHLNRTNDVSLTQRPHLKYHVHLATKEEHDEHLRTKMEASSSAHED